jgi:large repetitive protein
MSRNSGIAAGLRLLVAPGARIALACVVTVAGVAWSAPGAAAQSSVKPVAVAVSGRAVATRPAGPTAPTHPKAAARHARAAHSTAVARHARAGVEPLIVGGVVNGGFETGTLTGWTSAGLTSVQTATVHSGTYAAAVGPNPSHADSSVSQTFTEPTGTDILSFWYDMTVCTYHSLGTADDWATATLVNNTTTTTTTPLAKICVSSASGWTQVSVPTIAGDSYTLTLTNHAGTIGDATNTFFDDAETTGLTIAKSANVASVLPGGTVTYTVTATNSGQTAYTGAAFSDSLSGVLTDGVYNNDASATAGTVAYSSPNLTWTGNLAVGAVATVTYSITVNNPAGGANVITDAVSSSTPGNNCPTPGSLGFLMSASDGPAIGTGLIYFTDGTTEPYTLNSSDWTNNTVVGSEVVAVNTTTQNQQGNTSVTKTANIFSVAIPLTPGEAVSYVVLPALGTLTGSAPALHVFAIGGVSASSLAASFNDVGITNVTATAAGNYDGNGDSFSETALTTAGAAPGATVTSSGFAFAFPNVAAGTSDNVVANGQTVTMTASTAQCIVTDTVLVPGLTIAKSANVSAVNAGGTVQYTITATNSGQTALTGAAFSDSLAGVLDDAVYNNNASATAGTVAYSSPNLTWTGSLAVGAVATITYSITVNNPDTGNGSLSDVVSSSTPGSNCPSGSNLLGFLLSASYGPASGTAVIHYTDGTTQSFTLTSPDWYSTTGPTGGAVAASTVYQNQVNNTTGPRSSEIFSESVALTQGKTPAYVVLPALGTLVSGTAALHIFAIGGVSSSSIASSYNNVGITNYTATAAGNFDGNGTSFSEQALTTVGAAPGAIITSGGVPFTFPNVAAGSSDNVVANGQTITLTGPTAQCAVTGLLVSGLTIVKSAGVSSTTPGSVVHYTVTVTDSGQTAYTGAAFSDSLTGVLDDATYNNNAAATTGTVAYTSPNLTWTGNLAIGAVATITYSVTANNPDLGSTDMIDTITSSTPGNNCVAPGTIGFLFSASNGPITGTGQIYFTDGTSQSYTLTSPDWFNTTPPTGGALAASAAYQNRSGNTTYAHTANIFSEAITLTAGKTVSYLVLPAGGALAAAIPALHVFAIGGVSSSSLASTYNDEGITYDTSTSPGNYDGGNSATFSEQALAAAGAASGSTVTSSGLTFTFPTVTSGINDNTVAEGQTVYLAPADVSCTAAVTDVVSPVLSITVPSTVSLGSATPGSTLSAQLGPVTVLDQRGLSNAHWTATVSTTSFTTGGASGPETITAPNVSYWSGPATSTTGAATTTPGQTSAAAAQALSASRTAFTSASGNGFTIAAWNPTLVVTIPAGAVVGTYTATVTHSVA